MPLDPISLFFIGLFVGASISSAFKEQILAWTKQAIANLSRLVQQKGIVRIVRKCGRFIKRMVLTVKENLQYIAKIVEAYIEDYLIPERIHDELDILQDKLGLEDYEEVSIEVLEVQIN